MYQGLPIRNRSGPYCTIRPSKRAGKPLLSKLKLLIGVAVSIAFVLFTEHFLGWDRVIVAWKEIALWPLVIALTLTFVSYCARALRIHHYFPANPQRHYAGCLRVTLQHNLMNFLLPMRTGELSFPYLMSRHLDVGASRSIPALIWFRLMDLHVILVIAGIALLAPRLAPWQALALGAAGATIPWLLYRFNQQALAWLHRRAATRPRNLCVRVLLALPQTGRAVVVSWLWTVAIWGFKLLSASWVFLQFLPTTADKALLAAIAGDLTGVLPIHGIAGAGTYEAGVVAILVPFAIDASAALQAAINLHIFLLFAAVVFGAASVVIPGSPLNRDCRTSPSRHP